METFISLHRLWRSFRPKSGLHWCYNNYNVTGEDPWPCIGRLTERKLVLQNERDISTNTKQLYFRHAFKVFHGEINYVQLAMQAYPV